MQTLTILTKLREELTQTERTITQAWQRYSQELSTKAFTEAEATTKRMAALHRRLASRLERIVDQRHRRSVAPTPGTPTTLWSIIPHRLTTAPYEQDGSGDP